MKKVIVFVNTYDAERVRDAIGLSGKAQISNYTNTVYSAPLSATPQLPRAIDEEKIEFACDDETYRTIVTAIDAVVPAGAVVDSWSMETL